MQCAACSTEKLQPKEPSATAETSAAAGQNAQPEPIEKPADPAAEAEASEQGSIFLSELSVTASPRALELIERAHDDDEFSRGLSVRLEVLGKKKSFGELTRRAKGAVRSGTIALADLGPLTAKDRPTKRATANSFIVDFEEPSVQRVRELMPHADSQPTPEQIEKFVSDVIQHKTYIRSFDVASRVAETRSGDCTEHAVLAAAILRSFGYPARVVLGVVLVGVRQAGADARLMAAGHAWVEQYRDGRWRVVDAALYVPEGADQGQAIGVPGLPEGVSVVKAYIPINVLTDETPSYSRALMNEQGIEALVRLAVDARAGERAR